MDRTQFLRGAVCGLCACTTASLAPPAGLAAGGTSGTEGDWRLPFVQRRYAGLLEILSSRMNGKAVEATLHALGTYCSSLADEGRKRFHGDVDAFAEAVRQSPSGDHVTYDREKGVIVMASDERADCFCPLISCSARTPKVACACSLGWQEHTWQTLLRKKVQVELKESVLRGGKRCVFEIRVGEALPAEVAG
jgi:hypothetical protein